MFNKSFKRPEDPQLDDEQIKELSDHLSNQSTEYLERSLKQLQEDSLRDRGPYPEGTVPANVNRTHNIISSILEGRGGSGINEAKG